MAQAAVNRTEPINRKFNVPTEYAKYWVCDPEGQKIGRVKEVFTNGYGEPEYLRVSMGLFGRKTVLIPVGGFVMVDEDRRTFTLQ